MQIKPHQIEHHARQRERFKMMRRQWHQVYNREVITEYSSYFSNRFVGVNQLINFIASELKEACKKNSENELDMFMSGNPIKNNITGLTNDQL